MEIMIDYDVSIEKKVMKTAVSRKKGAKWEKTRGKEKQECEKF